MLYKRIQIRIIITIDIIICTNHCDLYHDSGVGVRSIIKWKFYYLTRTTEHERYYNQDRNVMKSQDIGIYYTQLCLHKLF